MEYTFLELQKQYKIIIPQIQRDYAQGREDKNSDDKIKGHDFIIKIIEVLAADKPVLNLDFVYGYTKKISKDIFAFIPLDGQQRLTTLWLLHWYLSPKKETKQNGIRMLSVSDNIKSYLKNFTCETRNSSKRFCDELIEEPLPVSNDICAIIKDANWFMASWQNDPTVVSMLNMLETIQRQKFNKEEAWKNLTENRKITFDYIDIKSDEFKLTDELYIKMNSRGKPLTEFENSKAQLSEILSAKDTEFIDEKLDYEGTKVTYQEYFSFRIDSVWTDLFWNFVIKIGENISSCFMNFFIYVAQMCYFKDNLDKNTSDFKNDFSVFKKKDNALFLFKALDFFYEISVDKSGQVQSGKITAFFESLFQKGMADDSCPEKVRLFEDNGVNLFEKCLLEGNHFENRNRIILYCLVSYMVKYDLKAVNANLRYYMRVIRNLLQATRQKNEIVYNTNVRINLFGKYWKLFSQIMENPNAYERLLKHINNKDTDIINDALANEKGKAKVIVDNSSSNQAKIKALFQLEDFKHFGGLIHNLNPQSNADNFIDWYKSIEEIWNCDDELIVASMITCGFGGFYTKNCRLGEMWFLGHKDNWNTILAGQNKIDDELSEPIILLLNKYGKKKLANPAMKPHKLLEKMVKEFIDSLTDKNWQYYFCKYREFFLRNSNYYSWEDDEFEHEILGSTGYNPLLAYHINPYVKAVSNILDDTTICEEDWCCARYSDESCIVLNNGFCLYSRRDGWHIEAPKGQSVSRELREKYNINTKNIFLETKGKDRIETAVEFCKDYTQTLLS